MRKLKVAIIGHFGGKEDLLDGQTVKTKILYEELSAHTDWRIKKVDTYYKKRNPAKLLLQTIATLISTRRIIVLLSRNGMKFYFPLLNFAGKVFRTRVYHDVIGGNLDVYIKQNPKFVKYLNNFSVNWVETNQLKKCFESCGVKNCEVIPNFKRLAVLPESAIDTKEKMPFRFCTFSRVMKEKGIEDAIAAVEKINSEVGETVCTLDTYGLIDKGYKERFSEVMSTVAPCVQYKGIVPFDKSVEAIKDYAALLFPTTWDGEGFPGTIVDAYSAGLPVIATDWNSNPEIIAEGKTGFIYPHEDKDGLALSMKKFMGYDASARIAMKKNCLTAAKEYVPQKWIGIIKKQMEK